MSKSLSEEFKDQKINDLLEDYIELEKKIDLIKDKIDNLPRELSITLESSLNKIALAVEEAEKTSEKLNLNSEIKKIAETIDISDKLKSIKKNAEETELKLKLMPDTFRDRDGTIINYILIVFLIITIILSSVSAILFYKVASKNHDQMNFWYQKYQEEKSKNEGLK